MVLTVLEDKMHEETCVNALQKLLQSHVGTNPASLLDSTKDAVEQSGRTATKPPDPFVLQQSE